MQLDILNSQSHQLSRSKARSDMCYLLLLPSLPRGQEGAAQFESAASSSPGFKGHSSGAEQCLRQPQPTGPRMGWGQCHQWFLQGILSQDESMLCSCHQAGTINSRGIEACFLRDAFVQVGAVSDV